MIVVIMVCTRVCVLIEVHQDVLNLSLLRRMHNHNNGRRVSTRSNQTGCGCTRHGLVVYELTLSKVIIGIDPCTAILGVESLRI